MIFKKKSSIVKMSLLLCVCLSLFAVPVFAQDFYGTEGSDTINGTTGNDTIQGRGGNDFLTGNSGDDVIFGDDGDDFIDAGAGNDTLQGGNGEDTLMGGTGDDTYFVNWASRWGWVRILEGPSQSENNRIILDYNSSDVGFFKSPFFADDLIIVFRYKGYQVTVEDFFAGAYIKTIQCNDVTYSRAQVISMAQ